MRRFASLSLVLVFALALAACAADEEPVEPVDDPIEPDMVETMAGPDTTGAAVWAFLGDETYQANWGLWPDKGEFYTGQEPHGMLLTTYLNAMAMDALQGGATEMPAGAVIVKENYMPDSTLAAVTVMVKVPGYNAEHNDWFFSKHLPDGSLDQTPDGMPMEGRLMGCQNCHVARAAHDYLFTGDLGGEPMASN